MNKNIIVALLAAVLGGWYFYNKNYSAAGSLEDGVYTDPSGGFALTFPPGWKTARERDISPENGFNISIPSGGHRASLVVVAPGPDKAVVLLRRAGRSGMDYKALAAETVKAMNSAGITSIRSRGAAGSGSFLPRVKAEAAMDGGALLHMSYFPGGKGVFMLVSIGEKNSRPELLWEFEKIADSARRI